MDYLTNYYKNLCEQLQEKVIHLEKLVEDLTTDESEIDFINKKNEMLRKLHSDTEPIATALGGTPEHKQLVIGAVLSGDFTAIPKQHHKALKKLQRDNGKLIEYIQSQQERREDPNQIFGAGQKVVGTTGKDTMHRLKATTNVYKDSEGRIIAAPNRDATYSREDGIMLPPKQ